MLKYLLFDLDDTLYSTSAGLMEEISVRMNEYMMTRVGVPESEVAELRQFYWRKYGTTLRGLYIERQIDAQEFLEFVHDIEIAKYIATDPRLDAMLTQLARHKFIFTNAPASHARRVLAALGIAKHFERIFDINFIAYESKPTPSGYAKVLSALGARGDECLMIDDTARNLVPAKALGMRTVWLDGNHDPRTAEGCESADAVIHTIYEVEKMFH
ncbi:MAG: pyrimidine 5'-nucleotidase [Chloroflexi bacterium]|nr:pyrimidine 5'-nucleotidase [Chloroflexota bacterium]